MFLLQKIHVLKLLLAKETSTHSLIQNQMASRYSNFPVSLYQDRSWDVFFRMNVSFYALKCQQYP